MLRASPLKPTKGSAVGDYLWKPQATFTSKAGVEKARAKLLIVFWEVHQLT
nr:MAG TPA: hypothetical protein [Inoviridae sp.]